MNLSRFVSALVCALLMCVSLAADATVFKAVGRSQIGCSGTVPYHETAAKACEELAGICKYWRYGGASSNGICYENNSGTMYGAWDFATCPSGDIVVFRVFSGFADNLSLPAEDISSKGCLFKVVPGGDAIQQCVSFPDSSNPTATFCDVQYKSNGQEASGLPAPCGDVSCAPAPPPPTCSNGGTDYPTCTPPTCSNGGTDYPTCTPPPPPTCSNGATDYPTCTPPTTGGGDTGGGGTGGGGTGTCANGATDYPTCTSPGTGGDGVTKIDEGGTPTGASWSAAESALSAVKDSLIENVTDDLKNDGKDTTLGGWLPTIPQGNCQSLSIPDYFGNQYSVDICQYLPYVTLGFELLWAAFFAFAVMSLVANASNKSHA